jgi:hypothetical protein
MSETGFLKLQAGGVENSTLQNVDVLYVDVPIAKRKQYVKNIDVLARRITHTRQKEKKRET